MELRVGQILVETYRLERLIGEGGMGCVYEASHLRVPKRFAVKFLNMTLVEKAEALVRFRREAEILATLDHPNIVGLYDYNLTDDGVPYFVLEFLDGVHLAKRLERGSMSLGEALRVIVPVARALEAAHTRGIVHRDLKPENIILTRDVVKVVDFGIAKMRGQAQDLTGSNSIIGTVPYMAPEQIAGLDIDARADQFALCAILYEMLTGEMAFGGPQSVPEIAMRVLHRTPPPIGRVPAEVNATIMRALSKQPAQRYATLGEFLDALVKAASRSQEISMTSFVVDGEHVEIGEGEEGLPPLAGESTAISLPPAPHEEGEGGHASHEEEQQFSLRKVPSTTMPMPLSELADLVSDAGPITPSEQRAPDETTELNRPPVSPLAPIAAPSGNAGGGAMRAGAGAMSTAQRDVMHPGDVEPPQRRATLPPNLLDRARAEAAEAEAAAAKPVDDGSFAVPESTGVLASPRLLAQIATVRTTPAALGLGPPESSLRETTEMSRDLLVKKTMPERVTSPSMVVPLPAAVVETQAEITSQAPLPRGWLAWAVAILLAVIALSLCAGIVLRHAYPAATWWPHWPHGVHKPAWLRWAHYPKNL